MSLEYVRKWTKCVCGRCRICTFPDDRYNLLQKNVLFSGIREEFDIPNYDFKLTHIFSKLQIFVNYMNFIIIRVVAPNKFLNSKFCVFWYFATYFNLLNSQKISNKHCRLYSPEKKSFHISNITEQFRPPSDNVCTTEYRSEFWKKKSKLKTTAILVFYVCSSKIKCAQAPCVLELKFWQAMVWPCRPLS